MPENIDSSASAENPMVKTVSAAEQPADVDGTPDPADDDATPTELSHPRLVDTVNGPDVSYEEAALEALYGPPDEDGIYGKGDCNA
jgi:heat shock protein HslJ